MERTLTYFVSDVHLGMKKNDPAEREARFVSWLKTISRDRTESLYLLGDIWDFWYEYRDVMPKEGARVVAQLIDLMDNGVKVYFLEGNHDMWSFSFFESIGIVKLEQPAFVEVGTKTFCIGHGDVLGDVNWKYMMVSRIIHSRITQTLFSSLHPWIGYRLATGWSKSSRKSHNVYHFGGESEPLYKYALDVAGKRKVDTFVFGHYHDAVDMTMPGGERFMILGDWMDGGCPALVVDKSTF